MGRSLGMVVCRDAYIAVRGFNNVGICNELPRCHIRQKIGPHCDCKDDAVDGRCGCHCRNMSQSCACPYNAHLKSRIVTCDDGLHAAIGDLACVAGWQLILLYSWGVVAVLAAALLLYFVCGVLRTAGLMPCRSGKATFEDSRIDADGSDSELRPEASAGSRPKE